jgi:phenylpropionate dioxygenase-like ring-hydroxylating dioxygenase large terminal subunit
MNRMNAEWIRQLVDDRPADGEFTVHRDVFRDPAIFELEMKQIFEGTWVFLGMACQLPRPHDYITAWIGRHPVVVSRDAAGRLHAFFNTCRHRGARVCHLEAGNMRVHVCQYHGWAYDSSGRNVAIKDRKVGAYTEAFDRQDHDLMKLPHFGEYRGFLFGCVADDVPPLGEWLGETRALIDLIVDQGPEGVELVPGCSVYTFDANWKLQIENCNDAYHLTTTHGSFMSIVNRRHADQAGGRLQSIDFAAMRDLNPSRGSFTFPYGHAFTWGDNPKPEARPLWRSLAEVEARVGETRVQWMLRTRNLTLFPSVQLADNASLQIRAIRPLAVDRTEMKIWCLAPVGESAAAREHRLRQYEDFFNATGMATPDDTATYEDCQVGYGARRVAWQQGYARGMSAVAAGPDDYARDLGIQPSTSISGPSALAEEVVFHASYREWVRLMGRGQP